MRYRTQLAILAALLVVGPPGAAGASGASGATGATGATERVVHLVTPDRDIECEMTFDPFVVPGGFGRVTCGIDRNRYRNAGSCFFDAREGWSRRWSLIGPSGSATAGAGPQRRCFSGAPVRVLRSGRALSVGPFRCAFLHAVVTCLSRKSGHGFSVSGKTQRVF